MPALLSFDLGNVIRLDVSIVLDDVPVDATAVRVIFRSPAGGETDVSVSHRGVGAYRAEFEPTASGQWLYRVTSTGVVSAEEGSFLVERSRFS